MDPSGSSTRLPVRGPPTPDSGPTLLLVTEHHQFHVWYQPNYNPSIKTLSCALLTIDAVADNKNRTNNGPRLGPGGVKLCISAAIGLGYGGEPLALYGHPFTSFALPHRVVDIDCHAISFMPSNINAEPPPICSHKYESCAYWDCLVSRGHARSRV
jgi:hypothetical protein